MSLAIETRPHASATPLPNSGGRPTERVMFALLPGERFLLRGFPLSPDAVPRYDPAHDLIIRTAGLFCNQRCVVIRGTVNGQPVPVAVSVTSFLKRTGINPVLYRSEKALARALRARALSFALPQLCDEECESFENVHELPRDSFLQKRQEGEKTIAEVRQWMKRGDQSILVTRRWNYNEGGFIEEEPGLSVELDPPVLQPHPRLSPEDRASLQQAVRELHPLLTQEVLTHKQSVSRELQLPHAGTCQIQFCRDGEIRCCWEEHEIDARDIKSWSHEWKLRENTSSRQKINERLPFSQKITYYLQSRAQIFRRQMIERGRDFGIGEAEATEIANAVLQHYKSDRRDPLIVGKYTVSFPEGIPQLHLGRHKIPVFTREGPPSRIQEQSVSWHLISGQLITSNTAFFGRHSTFVANHLVCSGMPIPDADKVNAFVMTHCDRLFLTAIRSNAPVTVRRGFDGLPYSLVFLPNGVAFAKIKSGNAARPPKGATKTGKRAYALFSPELWMRLVADPVNDPTAKARIHNEFSLFQKLPSSHMVRPVAVVETTNKRGAPRITLVENRCNLGSLASYLKYLTTAQRLAIADDLMRGLNDLHRAKIVHRDLKPENIFLHAPESWRYSPQAKICAAIGDLDLGIQFEKPEKEIRLAGTPYFMSPEKKREFSSFGLTRRWTISDELRADLWSMGIVLCELFGIAVPDFSETDAITCSRPSLLETISGNSDVDALISKMLCINPSQRPTAAQALQHWEEIGARRASTLGKLRLTFKFPVPEPYPDPADLRASLQERTYIQAEALGTIREEEKKE